MSQAPSNASLTCDVVVVGGGISGLVAAKYLRASSSSLSVVLLEASDRIGGRTLVDEEGTDLGGAYFGPGQDRVLKYIGDLGLQLQRVNTVGQSIQFTRGKAVRFDGLMPPLPTPLHQLDLICLIRSLEALCQTIDMRSPHLSPNAAALDAMTAEELLHRHSWTTAARDTFRRFLRAILCAEPRELSALFALWYMRQAGGVLRILDAEGGAQDSKVVGGAGQIALGLHEMVRELGVEVRLSSPVRRVDYNDATWILVETSGLQAAVVAARHVILAVPPVQQLRVEFSPSLSPNRFQCLQRWPMGHMIKTFTYYATPFWRDLGLNGQTISEDGVVCETYEDIKPDGSLPCLMGFVHTDHAAAAIRQDREARRVAVASQYAAMFGAAHPQPVGYKEKCWSDEPWVGGCYVGVMPPHVATRYQFEHRRPLADERIFVAGTEAAYAFVGYMDGAVEAGERAARNVLVMRGLLPQSEFDQMSQYPPSDLILSVPKRLPLWQQWLPPFPVVLSVTAGVALLGVRWMASRLHWSS